MKKWIYGLLVLGWIPTLLVVGGVRWFAPAGVEAQERTPIKITRIYTGEDGKTHAEEIDVPLSPGNRATTELSEAVPVTSVQFRRSSPAYYIDWHTAPRRQYVITLAGESEVEIGDGTRIRPAPRAHPAGGGHDRPGAHFARHRQRGPHLALPAASRAVAAAGRVDRVDLGWDNPTMAIARADSKRRVVIPGARPGDVFDIQQPADDQRVLVRLRPPEIPTRMSREACLEAISRAPLQPTRSWEELRRLTREP